MPYRLRYGIRRSNSSEVITVPNNPEIINAGDINTVLDALHEQGLPALVSGLVVCELHITELPPEVSVTE